ncbi:hypothetical protein [Rhodovulum euryhalinum]|uniref:Uncharacterized protein n=1 Tax=Rhodovulum euryhalinum TaxID=35805 RepID=A0A4R2KF03_9RHOB|nr:hypothetical protein [Rhodovulum euryhalinum]TCO68889.1 hypothetical protein EV655_1216 [Rhodovulum euryhalinum]
MTLRTLTLLLLAFLAGLVVYWLAGGAPGSFAQEDGPLEIWSACLLFLAAASSLIVMPVRFWPRYAFVFYGFFQLGLRELPFDPWIFDERVLTASFYRETGVSAAAVAGALYAALALWSVFALFRWGVPASWRALRARSRWLVYFGLAGVSAVIAQGAEELIGVIPMSPTVVGAMHVVEEGLEAVFALALFQALYVAWRR